MNKITKLLLTPLGWGFRLGVVMRHHFYDRNWLKKKFALKPVVSIGNVVAGGAGKTQAVLLLAEELAECMRLGILSRGYRSDAEHAKEPVLVDPAKHSTKMCGDEPFMLAKRLSSSLVIANKDRFKSALVAAKYGAELLILDDGMQHRKLHRDFEMIVIDGSVPFGSFLPKGRLREDLSRLSAADLILFVAEPTEKLKSQVAAFSDAPQVVAKIAVSGPYLLDGQKIDAIRGKKVGVFCGIGNPERFVKTVEEQGAYIVATSFSPDHQFMGEKNLCNFATYAKKKGAQFLICTEKDQVKIPQGNFPLPIGWLQAKLEIVHNHGAWQKMLGEMKLLAGVKL